MDRKLYNWAETKSFRRQLRRDMTPAEKILWRYLRGSQIDGVKFRRQQGIGPYVADFYCSTVKLVIEIDGESHYDDLGIAHDQARDAYMHANAMKILRFTNNDVTERLEGVIETIRETLRAANA